MSLWLSGSTAEPQTNFRQLNADFKKLGLNEERHYDLSERMKSIGEHLDGIQRHGNSAYRQDYAKPELPDDMYG